MKADKRKKLQRAGFEVGGVCEFLNLSDEEAALIDLKVRLVRSLRSVRQSAGITQHALAKLLGSSQSRVAKMEAGDPAVTLDLICKALFALGTSRKSIARMISSRRAA